MSIKHSVRNGLAAIILTAAGATSAYAMNVYHLENNKYAIVCADGSAFTFSGSAAGAIEAGKIICESLGSSIGTVTGGGPVKIKPVLNGNAMVALDKDGRYKPVRGLPRAAADAAVKPAQ